MKWTKMLFLLLIFSISSVSVLAAYPVETQKEAREAEMDLTRRLRAKIMADNQLSTEAHNVKIITMPKAITLKGPVASRAEKVKLENYARSMAGDKKVYNQLTY